MKRTVVLWSIAALLTAYSGFVLLGGSSKTAEPDPTGGRGISTAGGNGRSRVVLDLDGLLTLTAALESSHLLRSGNGELALNLALAAREDSGSGARIPIDVGLVLDRSGSMEGEKLVFAKQAAQRLVGLLRPGDRVAIVSYASDVTVDTALLDASQASVLQSAIWSLAASGSTNLDGGLDRAVALLTPHARPGRAQRVILISDGEANVGRTTLPELSPVASGAAERGVSVSTIGVGLSFNEQLMMGLADGGAGNYHYVRDGAGLAGAFDQEFDRMARTVARAAVVEVTPAAGVAIADVAGHTFERMPSGAVRIRVGDLFSGGQRKVLLRLQLAPGTVGAADAASVSLQTEDPRSGRVLTARADLGVVVTEQVAEVEHGRDREVTAAVAEVRAAEQMSAAMRQYENGDSTSARATLRGFADQLTATGRSMGGAGGARMLESARQLYEADRGVLAAPAASSEQGRDLARRARAQAHDLAR